MKTLIVSADTQLRFRSAASGLNLPLEKVVDIYSGFITASLDRSLVPEDFEKTIGAPAEGLERDGYAPLPVTPETMGRLIKYAGCLGFSCGDLVDYFVARDGGLLRRISERPLSPETWTAVAPAIDAVKARRGKEEKKGKGGKGA